MTITVHAPTAVEDAFGQHPTWCDPTLCTAGGAEHIPSGDSYIVDDPYVWHRGVLHADSLTDVDNAATRVEITVNRFDRPGETGVVEHTVRIGDDELNLTGRVLDTLQALVDAGRAVR